MAIQSSNEFAERERERERRALNVRDSRNESKTNIQTERERERLVKYIKINCFFFFKLCFFDFFDRYGKVFSFFFFWGYDLK